MLEHWWNVMASLDEDATTDVLRGIGRVDESYAGPLRRSMRDPQVIEPQLYTMDSEDDLTVRRISPVTAAALSAPSPVSPVPGASLGSTMLSPPSTSPGAAPSSGGDMTLLDMAPNTEPSPSTNADLTEPDDDPFDMPTRSDPSLRKLVERELELHRKRREPPR
jgi:hypothetical protein